MLTRSLRLASSLLLILGLPTGAAAAGLEAGAARVDITPGLGLGMYGFASRKGGATGVLDPLMARVLVLEAGETRLAYVRPDTGARIVNHAIVRVYEMLGRLRDAPEDFGR